MIESELSHGCYRAKETRRDKRARAVEELLIGSKKGVKRRVRYDLE